MLDIHQFTCALTFCSFIPYLAYVYACYIKNKPRHVSAVYRPIKNKVCIYTKCVFVTRPRKNLILKKAWRRVKKTLVVLGFSDLLYKLRSA
uniref:Putative secreted protein n=1 Tax=Ixodes ricinus TaxID=34613 RepID=A0A6B0U1B5_IXORI